MADLSEAELKVVHLFQSNLFGGYAIEANLNWAIADSATRWPEGFDPEAAGVVFNDV